MPDELEQYELHHRARIAIKPGIRIWLAKEDVRPTYYKNRVNAGLHVIDP